MPAGSSCSVVCTWLTATLFALIVPRLMGPDLFGRYSLLTSVSMWFAMLSGLGAVSLLTRIVPQFSAAGDVIGLRKLVTNLLVLRACHGPLDRDRLLPAHRSGAGRARLPAALLVAVGVFSRTVGNLCLLAVSRLEPGGEVGHGRPDAPRR